MKLAITNTNEILSLLRILNELEDLHKHELQHKYLKDVDLSQFEILKNFDNSDPEQFLSEVLRHLSNIHFQRILWNADTLLNHCADLEQDTLDYHPNIKKGLELLEQQEKETTP